MPQCPGRYTSLTLPVPGVPFPVPVILENGQAYEIGSQLANLLKNGPNSPLPGDFVVQRIFHAGQSQQGGSVTTYSGEFHFPGVNDGYFIQAAGGTRAAPQRISRPTFPPGDPNGRAPTDLPVPVIRAQTETDMFGVLAGNTRQSDTETFRYYEMAGVAHNVVHKDIEALPAGVIGPDPLLLEDVCVNPMNTAGDGRCSAAISTTQCGRTWRRRFASVSSRPMATCSRPTPRASPATSMATRWEAFGYRSSTFPSRPMSRPIPRSRCLRTWSSSAT